MIIYIFWISSDESPRVMVIREELESSQAALTPTPGHFLRFLT